VHRRCVVRSGDDFGDRRAGSPETFASARRQRIAQETLQGDRYYLDQIHSHKNIIY